MLFYIGWKVILPCTLLSWIKGWLKLWSLLESLGPYHLITFTWNQIQRLRNYRKGKWANTSFCSKTWTPIYVSTTLPTYLISFTYISHFFFVLQSVSAKEGVWTLIKECLLTTTTKFPPCNLSNVLSFLHNFAWFLN